MTTRALVLPRFKARKPEELPEALDRLVVELEAELARARLSRSEWSVAPQFITSGSGTVTLAWQTAHLVDTAAADATVRLPYGRAENVGQRVRIVKVSASNDVVVYPAGGQHVSGAASQTVTTAGVREYMWCGDGGADASLRGWRLVT